MPGIIGSERSIPRLRSAPIALDAMGSDLRPVAEILGAADAVATSGSSVVLVGDRVLLEREMDRVGVLGRLAIQHAPETIARGESPGEAFRRKPRSSLRVALEMVRCGEASAMVSAGNTGALLVSAASILGRIHGVERPALGVGLPGLGRPVVLCDAGANASCRAGYLLGFARLASCMVRVASGRDEPIIGLLANGTEPAKDNDFTRAARRLLDGSGLAFAGCVEPHDLCDAAVDVVVTDGFTGSVLLKSMEATAHVARGVMERAVHAGASAAVGSWLVRRALRRDMTASLDDRESGGALLLGVDGLVFSLHGRSERRAIHTALRQASGLAASGLARALREAIPGPGRESRKSAEDAERAWSPAPGTIPAWSSDAPGS
jgi:glycerol-3-phosphate acyltransferase PlsX